MDRGSLLKIAFAALVASVVAWIYASGAYEELDPAEAAKAPGKLAAEKSSKSKEAAVA